MTRRNRSSVASPAQPDLFSFVMAMPQDSHAVVRRTILNEREERAPVECAKPKPALEMSLPRRRNMGAPTRVVSLEDLPHYPQIDRDLVDQTIAALPPGKMWFTYQAIRECFGVSRATVARRVKRGLVPGIRFSGNSVIEDGSVRRFDRTQLRWLLLSVRSQRHDKL